MKNTNKKIVAGLAASAIIALSFGSASANWHGNGQWGGQGNGLGKIITAEEKAKLQSMSENERQEYIIELKEKYNFQWNWNWNGKGNGKGKWQGNWNSEWKKGWNDAKKGHNTADMLADIEKQDVSAIEIDLLEKQYEEEMMANELYMSFYEKYWIQTFKNIAESEAKHMKAVKALLDRYEIEVPKNYDHIQYLYEELKEKGSKSAFDALEVWVQIEFVDIDDIVKAIKSTDNDDIKVVLTNIGWGSYNHLRWFLKAIENNGYETELDYTPYLEESDLSTTWPIKYKLAEKLESEWVELPEQVSSENMKNQKCDDEHGENGEWNKWEKNNKKENANKWKWNNNWKNANKVKWKNYDNLNKYKTAISSKYWDIINAMSNEKLEKVLVNIDSAIEKVKSNSNYNTSTKQKYNLILNAFKEVIQEKLDDVELDIEGLLE